MTLPATAKINNWLHSSDAARALLDDRDSWVVTATDEADAPLAAVNFKKNVIALNTNLLTIDSADTEATGAARGLILRELVRKNAAYRDGAAKAPLPKKAPEQLAAVVELLERTAVERAIVDRTRFPVEVHENGKPIRSLQHSYLRQLLEVELKVAAGDGAQPQTELELALLWGQLVGRAVAGIVNRDEVEYFDDIVRQHLGDDRVDMMTDILGESSLLGGNLNRGSSASRRKLHRLADEFLDLFRSDEGDGEGDGEPGEGEEGESSDTEGESSDGDSSSDKTGSGSGEGGGSASGASGDDDGDDDADSNDGSSGDDGDESDDESDADGENGDGDEDSDEDGEGAGSGDSEPDQSDDDDDESDTDGQLTTRGHGYAKPLDDQKELGELLTDAVRDVSQKVEAPETPKQVDLENPQTMVEKVNARRKKQKPAKAERVPAVHAYPDGKETHWEVPPTKDALAAAKRLTRLLEQVNLPSIAHTKRPSTLPPGRLNGREMVRKAADKQAGRMTQAKPWKNTKRVRTTHRPLKVGVMTDTSGSMTWAQTIVGEFAWAMSKAGRSIGARTTSLTFGDHVDGVVLPEDPNALMKVFPANGGSEAFDEAAAAMEGLMHLGENDGTNKLLFIVSDAALVRSGEMQRAALWARKWSKAGTKILWVGADEFYITRAYADYQTGEKTTLGDAGITFLGKGEVTLNEMLAALEDELRRLH